MPYSTPEDEGKQRSYRQSLNYENVVLLSKIREISIWRDTDTKAYESGIRTLSLLLPKELRSRALDFYKDKDIKEDLTGDGVRNFDDYFVYILTLLEDVNICFPKLQYHEGKL